MSFDLNPQQIEAVKYLNGPLLVLAGAGSGKTRVITHKIAYLIKSCGIKPAHVYAVTFTNKAAREMAARAKGMLGVDARGLKISTFHTLGYQILKKEREYLSRRENFSLFDEADSFQVIKELSEDLIAKNEEILRKIKHQISLWKNNLITPEMAALQIDSKSDQQAFEFYSQYEKRLKTYNAIDFDDLIIMPVQLLKTHPELKERWQNQIRYLLVDEYQDTNQCQYAMIQLLTGSRQAFTVVGDDDQSVYAWRGARPENLHELNRDYPSLHVIKLEQNYRSHHPILSAANTLIAHNPHLFTKALWSVSTGGEKVKVLTLKDEKDEAESVINDIVTHRFYQRSRYSDYAILYRSNHHARLFEQALRQQGIPYHISGGTSFFSHVEIKDLMAYFRLLVNGEDDAAFLRAVSAPKRDIGAKTLEKLGEYAQIRQSSLLLSCAELGLSEFLPSTMVARLREFSDFIQKQAYQLQHGECGEIIASLMEAIQYETWIKETAKTPKQAERRLENVKDLLNWIQTLLKKDEGQSLPEILNKMVLLDRLENEKENKIDAVQLMTLHAAKGLEFSYVYVVGCEEDILPHKTSIEENTVEEERRLMYVGMTRAMKLLTLTYASMRKNYGEYQVTTASRFLGELGDTVEWPLQRQQAKTETPDIRQERGVTQLAALRAMLSEKP